MLEMIFRMMENTSANPGAVLEFQKQLLEHYSQNADDETAISRRLSETYCENHSNLNHFRCMDCDDWICDRCVTGSHNECRTLPAEDALDELKQAISKKVKNKLDIINIQNGNVEYFLKVIERKRHALQNHIDQLQQELICRINKLKSLEICITELQFWKMELIKYCDELKDLPTSVLEVNGNLEFKNASYRLENFLEQVRKIVGKLTLPKQCFGHLTIDDIRSWCETESVYATRNHQEITQYGKLSVKGNQIWIQRFRLRRPAENHVLISFKELLLNFNQSSKLPRKAFLQVGDNSSVYGDVVIATNDFSPRALDFLLLCSGINGRSYEGNDLFNWVDGIGIVTENEGGAMVKGIRDGGAYEAPRKKYSVEGWLAEDSSILSGFTILMKDVDGSWKMKRKFGTVEEGFEVLEGLTGITRSYSVKNCGLVVDTQIQSS